MFGRHGKLSGYWAPPIRKRRSDRRPPGSMKRPAPPMNMKLQAEKQAQPAGMRVGMPLARMSLPASFPARAMPPEPGKGLDLPALRLP